MTIVMMVPTAMTPMGPKKGRAASERVSCTLAVDTSEYGFDDADKDGDDDDDYDADDDEVDEDGGGG